MNTKTTCNQLASLVFGACIMTAFSSCNDHRVKSGSGHKVETIEELTVDGTYDVKFLPLNSSVSGFTNAKGRIHIIADQVTVAINVKDSPAMTTHSQYIYNATECPTDMDDLNHDGFIDPQEVSKVLNEVLIPLDGNLNSQEEGFGEYPLANAIGDYKYFQEGYLSHLIDDLHLPDLNLKDGITKLSPEQSLKLDGKVIVIEGISEDIYLPGSIRNIGNQSDRASLPIACGKISRVKLLESETSEAE